MYQHSTCNLLITGKLKTQKNSVNAFGLMGSKNDYQYKWRSVGCA